VDLVLALMTLRARGEAREARYARIVRSVLAAQGNHAHPCDERPATERWRTFRDHGEPSLPRLVREADRRWRRRSDDDHAGRLRERLAARHAAEVDLCERLGLPVPPSGRPRRPHPRTGSVRGHHLADHPDLLAEWAWDVNGDLDPGRLAAGSHALVAWRCLLDPAHVWEARVADRTSRGAACPFHMGTRVHPAESLAAFFPWLAREWHPTRNARRPRRGQPGVGTRGRLALRAGSRVDGGRVSADPVTHGLSGVLPVGGPGPFACRQRARRMRDEAVPEAIPFRAITAGGEAS
jgi:hypothetical protein